MSDISDNIPSIYLSIVIQDLATLGASLTRLEILNAAYLSALLRHPLGFTTPSRWDEFFEKFRLPDHLSERFLSNLQYFIPQYCKASFFVLLLISLLRRSNLTKVLFLQFFVVFALSALQGISNRTRATETAKNPSSEAVAIKLCLLAFVNALLWVATLIELLRIEGLLGVSLAVALHATLRTRNWTRVVKDILKKE